MIRLLITGFFATMTIAGLLPDNAVAQDIDFMERFALSSDRESTLDELVPGTEEYYFYHSLHHQNTQQFGKAAETIRAWDKWYETHNSGRTGRYNQIRHRQALLTYGDSPQKTIDYLIDKLDLRFNHQRLRPSAEPGLPTELDQAVISFDRLNRRALSRSNTQRYEDIALTIAAVQTLSDSQLRHLLERLSHPAIADLPKLIARDLENRDSRSFGSYTIHKNLLLDQLDEVARLRPRLKNEPAYVNIYLSKLAPGNDVNWRFDKQEHLAYLERLWSFVSQLNSSHNSLKAAVLFRRLELDRTLGVYDQERFVEYLKLPRQLHYVSRQLIKNTRLANELVNLGVDYRQQFGSLPINSDEPLVRDYLHYFLVDASDYNEYLPYVNSEYLLERFAEAKVTAGLGDVEQWAARLSPAKYQELMKRIDLDFAFTNPVIFDVDDPVELKLSIKNVKNLIVKVFEINTANYYRNNNREINTDINLDGLVPNWQKTIDYDEAPIRRVERTFSFGEIDHEGVFVIDFIGNGKSSRALVRKGQLSHLVETTAAGHRFSVFNNNKEQLKDASLWIAGRSYSPDDEGYILVPFSTQPGSETLIMERAGLSVRGQFSHLSESYHLEAGIHVDRESLLRGGKASVIVRPQLKVAGQPAPLSLLKDIRLLVRATDLDGVESTKEFSDIKLAEEHETEVEILVPSRLQKVDFALTAKVDNVSRGEPQVVNAGQAFQVNQIDSTQTLQTVHLRQNDLGYQLAVRGKTGEPRRSQAVMVKLKHRLFTDTVTANLQSDEKGQVRLGALNDISWIEVTLNGSPARLWNLENSSETVFRTVNTGSEQSVRIPCGVDSAKADFSLIELRANQYYKNHSSRVSVAEGLVSIEPLDPGDYQLTNLKTGRRNRIQVTRGTHSDGYVMGTWRTLEIRDPDPIHVKNVEVSEDKVRIHLGGDGSYARVHVIATRYQPRFDAFAELARVGDIEPLSIRNGLQPNAYVAGRSIGEEYQYILDRQFHEKFPGNMLTRPSLLLNPWALRTTENNVQVARTGDDFQRSAGGPGGAASRGGKSDAQSRTNRDFANLDFLADGSVVLANLLADDEGMLEIDQELFGEKHMLQIVVQDHFQTLIRHAILPESSLKYRDLRLANSLDADRHFAQQKQYTVLRADEDFELDDVSTAKFQQYDDLSDIYRYYVTLTGNSQLIEFGFLMQWPELSDEKKLELYKRYACHEFNFFLRNKDPDYFDAVIEPYLANKMHQTFLDEYLLELDVQSWVKPWEFQRLNTAEQILLGQRLDNHRRRLNQLIGDDYDNHPTSRRAFDRLYDYAVAGSALDASEKSIAFEGLDDADGNIRLLREGAAALKNEPMENSRALADFDSPLPPGAAPARQQNMESRRRAGRARESLGRADRDKSGDGKKSGEREELEKGQAGGGGFGGGGRGRYRLYADDELDSKRKSTRQFYQRIKPTREWVENNYYQLPVEQQNSALVRVNRFWRDYAMHDGQRPFLSPFFAESSRNFSEMMLALSVLDLPFEKPDHDVEYVDNKMMMTPGNDLIAFYQQVRPAAFDRGESTVLVSENFFRVDDRYRVVDGKTREKFARKEFISNVLYGGQVVITNPTSTPQEIDLLIQVPTGAIPASSSHETRTMQMDMAAFSTQTFEYFFYFPTPGDFAHYPAHVSVETRVVAVAEGLRFNVVESPSELDTESWAYISQNGSTQQVLDYLESQNLQSIDLAQIAFRMKDKEFYRQVIALLNDRFSYNHTLWSYAVKHNDAEEIGHFLKHSNSFVAECGTYLRSRLLNINPVIRHIYQHREYWPLVNARAHQLGSNRKILNNAIWQQYHLLLDIIARQAKPGDEEQLATTCYLLLQDRISQAISHFDKVEADRLSTRLQYDYFGAYIAMYQGKPDDADAIAKRYLNYPVKRWRDLFAAVSSQVAEINGGDTRVVDATDQTQRQTESASNTPNFEFVVESLKTKVQYQNLSELTINYYQMDVELLFSRNPFVQRQDESYALIKPNVTENVSLDDDESSIEIDLPEQFRTSNVLVEITAGGKTDRKAYYANSMNVQMIDQYGQVNVSKSGEQELLSRVYVKVYARKADGSIHFYKDGYTDLRGRFDYASLSNQDLNDVERFSILVISPEFGAVVREAGVPKE